MTSIILPSNATDPSQITSETLPTTRADGSALQIGDRWYKPSTGKEGFWNGALWLGDTYLLSVSNLGIEGTANFAIGAIPFQTSIFVESWKTGFFTSTAINNTNYVSHRLLDGSGNIISVLDFQTFDTPFVDWRHKETTVNSAVTQTGTTNVGALLFSWQQFGTVSTRFGYVSVTARNILS